MPIRRCSPCSRLPAALLPLLTLGACWGGSGPSADLSISTAASAAPAAAGQTLAAPGIAASSSLWTDATRGQALELSSGDGVKTTASSAIQLMQAGNGLYFGSRQASEDWEGLSRRYKTDASVANWVNATERPRIDAWIARKFERADLVGGWTTAYIDTKGTPIRWRIDAPEPPDDSAAGDFKSVKRAWVAWGREYNIDQAQAAARLYRLTRESRYAEWAALQLDFYAENYARWPQRTTEGRSSLFAQGLDEATRAFALVDTARLLRDYAGPQRYGEWRDKLFLPMAANLQKTSAPMSNIQLWHKGAIAAIAMRFGDMALLDEAQNGNQGIKAIMANGLQADNFWIEGTFSYNAYVIQALSHILVHAGIEGHADRFAELREQAGRMLLVNFDYRFDDNSLPNPNDSVGAQEVANKRVHWNLFRVVPTYWGLQLANEWRTWEQLLDPPPKAPAKAPAIPTARTRNFPTVRQAVLRAGDWQAYVHYGQVHGNHVSDELTTFELQDGLTPIARDPGTVSYASPYHKEYFQRGAANNVPLIDGNGQTRWAPGVLKTFDAAQNLLTVEQPVYQVDAAVTRSYRLTDQGFVERADISVLSRNKRRLGVVFNTTCAITLGSATSPSSIPTVLPNVPALRSYWNHVSMATAGAQWQAQLDCAGKKYSMRVYGPAGQRIYTAKVPNTPLPATRNAIYYEVEAASASFETEFRRAD